MSIKKAVALVLSLAALYGGYEVKSRMGINLISGHTGDWVENYTGGLVPCEKLPQSQWCGSTEGLPSYTPEKWVPKG